MAAADKHAILYFGLNPGAAHEAAALRGFGAKVLFIGNSDRPDRVLYSGKPYDLAKDDGRKAFLTAMKLPEHKRRIVDELLKDAGKNMRDEFAKLAIRWASSEVGHLTPTRMVISSHHAGAMFWGDGNGTFEFTEMKKLASAFPRAARAIEHLHFAACYSAQNMMEWPSAFPNLQSIWAYSGSAPGSASGSLTHLRIWERATRLGNVPRRSKAEKTRKGENVSVWSRQYGREERAVDPVETLIAMETADRHVYDEFFAGDQTVVDTDANPLRDYYNVIQNLLNHPDLPPAQRPVLETKRDKTIRLIFFQKEVRKKFQEAYAKDVAAGYQAIGLAVPNFANLTRKQAMAVIAEYLTKAARNRTAAVTRCLRLVEGLRDLDSQIIPINWL